MFWLEIAEAGRSYFNQKMLLFQPKAPKRKFKRLTEPSMRMYIRDAASCKDFESEGDSHAQATWRSIALSLLRPLR